MKIIQYIISYQWNGADYTIKCHNMVQAMAQMIRLEAFGLKPYLHEKEIPTINQ